MIHTLGSLSGSCLSKPFPISLFRSVHSIEVLLLEVFYVDHMCYLPVELRMLAISSMKEGHFVFNDAVNTCLFMIIWRERERNDLFNDALNTFYLRLYGVRHMVKDHSDSEKGNPLPPHRLLLSINSKGSFICTIPLTG